MSGFLGRALKLRSSSSSTVLEGVLVGRSGDISVHCPGLAEKFGVVPVDSLPLSPPSSLKTISNFRSRGPGGERKRENGSRKRENFHYYYDSYLKCMAKVPTSEIRASSVCSSFLPVDLRWRGEIGEPKVEVME